MLAWLLAVGITIIKETMAQRLYGNQHGRPMDVWLHQYVTVHIHIYIYTILRYIQLHGVCVYICVQLYNIDVSDDML